MRLDFSEGSEPTIEVIWEGWSTERKALFQERVAALPGVNEVRTAGGAHSLHIRFDPNVTDREHLQLELATLRTTARGDFIEASEADPAPATIGMDQPPFVETNGGATQHFGPKNAALINDTPPPSSAFADQGGWLDEGEEFSDTVLSGGPFLATEDGRPLATEAGGMISVEPQAPGEGRRSNREEGNGNSAPPIMASSWTGVLSGKERLVAARALLPAARDAIGVLIDDLETPRGNFGPLLEDRKEALDVLRRLHVALGDMITLAEHGNLKQGLSVPAAEIASFFIRLRDLLRGEPVACALLSVASAAAALVSPPGLDAVIAGGAALVGKVPSKPKS